MFYICIAFQQLFVYNLQTISQIPFYALQEQSMPYITFDTLENIFAWNEGFFSRVMSTAVMLRISERGLYSIEHAVLKNLTAAVERGSWFSQRCIPALHALCEENNTAKMQYFNQKRISVPENWQDMLMLAQQSQNQYLLLYNNSFPCAESGYKRVVSVGDSQYELSVCDLLESKLDILYNTKTMQIFWRQDNTSYLQYLLLGFIGIYLTSCIANNIVYVLQIDNISERIAKKVTEQDKLLDEQSCRSFLRHNFTEKYDEIISHLNFDNGKPSFVKLKLMRQNMILLPLLVYLTWQILIVSDFIILQSDQVASVLLLIFMWVEYAAVNLKADVYTSYNVSLICAMLFLISVRIHYTLDNPYLLVLCIIFGIRSFFKFFAYCCYEAKVHSEQNFLISCVRVVLRVYDFLVFSYLVENGISISEPDSILAEIRKSIVMFVSFILGAILFLFHLESKIEIQNIVDSKFKKSQI